MPFTATTLKHRFTLIELVVVVLILASVATMAVVQFGNVEAQTEEATAAATSAQLASNLEAYKTSTGSYPMGLDTLLEVNGSDVAMPLGTLFTHDLSASGITYTFGVSQEVEAWSPAGTAFSQSLGHGFTPPDSGGEVYFFHNAVDAGASLSERLEPFGANVGDAAFAAVISDDQMVKGAPGTYPPFMQNRLAIAAGYEDGIIPADEKLLAFGIGPNCGLIGETLSTTPTHAGAYTGEYNRYIALIAVYSDRRTAKLKTVLDSQGVSIEGRVADYHAEGFAHE